MVTISDVRKNEIAKTARDLRERFAFDKPPVNAEAIAERSGVNVVFSPFEEPVADWLHGYYDADENQITVNVDDTPEEILFTIAHELGHALMHRENYVETDSYVPRLKGEHASETKEEIEADFFACELLAPKEMIKSYSDSVSLSALKSMFVANEDILDRLINVTTTR